MSVKDLLLNLGGAMWNSDPQNFTPAGVENTYNINNPVAPVNTALYGSALGASDARALITNFDVSDSGTRSVVAPSGNAGSAGGQRRRSASPQFQYIDAALAQQYGMNRETAYQEALANTSHQREVQDLIKAGLNPVLSARYGGAAVFNPSGVATSSSGGGSGGSGGSGKSSAQNLKLIGSVLGAVVTIASGSSSAGKAVSEITNAAISSVAD